jgi:hypothetical protein
MGCGGLIVRGNERVREESVERVRDSLAWSERAWLVDSWSLHWPLFFVTRSGERNSVGSDRWWGLPRVDVGASG